MNNRERAFCFTWFRKCEEVKEGYTEEQIKELEAFFEFCDYAIRGFEICPTTKKEHIQGYFYIKNKISWNTVRLKFPGISLKTALGSAKKNQTYCSKEGNFKEWGELPEQGKRYDISKFRDSILNGTSEEDLIMEYPNEMAKYDRFYQRCRNILLKKEAKKMIQPEVIVITGEPGIGKTHHIYANENIEDIYKVEIGDGSSGSIFWDNYNGESIILIDDFHNNFKLDYMLRLLDKYPMKLNIKGGYTWKCAKKIYITSNINPNEWYHNCPNIHRKALKRRITKELDLTNLTTQHNKST